MIFNSFGFCRLRPSPEPLLLVLIVGFQRSFLSRPDVRRYDEGRKTNVGSLLRGMFGTRLLTGGKPTVTGLSSSGRGLLTSTSSPSSWRWWHAVCHWVSSVGAGVRLNDSTDGMANTASSNSLAASPSDAWRQCNV